MKYTIENYHKIILEVEDYAFLLLDEKGTIRDWNKGAEKLKGYTAQEIIGQNLRVFYTIEDRNKKLPERLIQKASQYGKAMDEGWRVRKDGSLFWGSILITALYDAQNKLNGFLKITRDLSEKKEMEEKLRTLNNQLEMRVKEKDTQLSATEKQLNYTLDNMLEGAQIYDSEWRFTYVNDALLKQTPYTREEVLGHTLMEKYPGIEQTDLFKILSQCKEDREARHLETEFNFLNGTSAHYELSILAIPQGMFILSIDITERKKAEEAIKKKNRLYAFLSQINQSIVHVRDEKTLLKKACEIATDIAKFQMSWIGLLDQNGILQMDSCHADQSLRVTVKTHPGVDYSLASMSDTPVGLTLRTGTTTVRNDTLNDPSLAPWLDEMIGSQLRSSIVIPIKKFGKLIGVFQLNSSVKDFFDEEEIKLLEEITGDISFALELFEKDKMRTQAEARVIQNEARLKQAQAIAHLGSWDMDLETGISIWSDENCRIFGIPTDHNRHTADSFLSFVHPHDISHIMEQVSNANATFADSSFYHRIIRPDGEVRYIHSHRRYIPDENGKMTSVYGTSHDVTEFKSIEDELRKSETNLRTIFENTDTGFLLMDIDYKVIAFNSISTHWSAILFATPLVSGTNLRENLIDEKLHAFDHMMGIIKKGGQINYEANYPQADDTLIWFHIIGNAVIQNNEVVGICLAVNDITQKKRTEQEVEDSEKKYRHLFYDNPSPLWVIEEKTFKFLDINNAAIEHYGYSREEFMQMNAIDLRPVRERNRFQNMPRSSRKGVQNSGIWTHIKKDGTEILVEVSSSDIIFENIPARLVLAKDVTEKTLAENQIKEMNVNLEQRVQDRTAELLEANQALEAFSYSVSHDLKAPVRAMLGFTKIIQEEYSSEMVPEAKELFGYVSESGKRMGIIIDDLLKLAQYGKETLKPGIIDMKQLIENVWANMARSTPHHMVLRLSEIQPVCADMSMMEQVIINLLSNAIKYSSKKEAPVVEVWSESHGETATFFFKDNGAGFDMKNYERLFGVFQRLHGMSEFEGTGIGLNLVKKIIEKHGGTIGAHAKVDEGATFYFNIPILHHCDDHF